VTDKPVTRDELLKPDEPEEGAEKAAKPAKKAAKPKKKAEDKAEEA
jgi:hypothetical protein